MGRYQYKEGFILENPEGLLIIPKFISAKPDPTISYLLNNQFIDGESSFACLQSPGDISFCPLPFVSLLFISITEGQNDLLNDYFSEVGKHIKELNIKDVHFGLLGISEFGYDEPKARILQEKWINNFLEENPEYNITFVIPDDEHRPQRGKHLGDEPLNDDEIDDTPVPKSLDHHTVTLALNSIHSYRDYLESYILARNRHTEIIRHEEDISVNSIKELGYLLGYYLTPSTPNKPYPMSKWSKPQKGKDGSQYCPKPSKQLLKLIIILLDMSYDEAIACFNFFGYGLARFDKEDIAYEYMLKKWPKPIDPLKADKTLTKRFGTKAAIIIKEK